MKTSFPCKTTSKRPKILKHQYEKQAWEAGEFACGIDEVGRGCLAGPVVVSAVILPINTTYRLLKDSKELSPEERVTAARWIRKNAIVATAIVNHRIIDRYNIYQATMRCMKRAFLNVYTQFPHNPTKLKYLLVDAMPLTFSPHMHHEMLEIYHFPFGETYSKSIAAASIIAKVTRDELMCRMASSFPNFGFERHKGYATPTHQEALRAHGKSFIHRERFLRKFITSTLSQSSLFDESAVLLIENSIPEQSTHDL